MSRERPTKNRRMRGPARGAGGPAAAALVLLLGQEHHADGVLAAVRQVDVERRALLVEELVRHLDEKAGAVAGARVGATGAAVAEVDEHLQPLGDDLVRALAADVGDEADAAGIVLLRGVVEALLLGARQIRKSIRLAHLSLVGFHPGLFGMSSRPGRRALH